jgi:hypothetical protein
MSKKNQKTEKTVKVAKVTGSNGRRRNHKVNPKRGSFVKAEKDFLAKKAEGLLITMSAVEASLARERKAFINWEIAHNQRCWKDFVIDATIAAILWSDSDLDPENVTVDLVRDNIRKSGLPVPHIGREDAVVQFIGKFLRLVEWERRAMADAFAKRVGPFSRIGVFELLPY